MMKQSVLIIEDDLDNSQLMRLLLEVEDFEVLSAIDGEQGLKIAQQHQPDLIILDLDMPILDGWGVIEALKQVDQTKEIPIIVVTAHLMPHEREKVLAAGGSGYVSKPFKVRELVAEIKACL